MVDVLCIGHSAYDVTLPLQGFPEENLKYAINYIVESGGGPSGNGAYLLSKWGLSSSYIGILGEDHYGKRILEEFNDVGVDTSMIKIEKNYSTPYSTIIVNLNNGSRTIVNYRVPKDDFDIDITRLKKINPKVILLDGHELKTSLKALELFPRAKTILDAGSVRENTLVLAEKVDYLIASERFALKYCEMDSIKREEDYNICINKMKNLNQGNIIITLGERGLIYEEQGEIEKIDAFEVNAVDTTGAGDIFHGAFAYGLIKEYSLIHNLKFASMAAALSVEKLGGRQSIPDVKEVLEKLEERERVILP